MGLLEKIKKKKPKPNIWEKSFNKKKIKKPEVVAIVYLRNNNRAETFNVETKGGFFVFNHKTYHVARDCIYSLNKDRIPLAIIEEDGLRPMGNSEFYKRLEDIKSFERLASDYQDYVLKAIRHAELVRTQEKEGLKINPKVAVGIIILLIIGYAIFRSYSG